MSPQLTDALVKLAIAVITLLGVFIEVYGVKALKAKFSSEQLKAAERVGKVAVNAAEALAANGVIDYKSKFAEASRRAKDMAVSKGIHLTDEQWESVIESAVTAMKQIGGEIWPDEEVTEAAEGE